MRVHRITWVDRTWSRRSGIGPYHPLHVPVDLQGAGRFDNPNHYGALYVAHSPQAAVGEMFGNHRTWDATIVERHRDDRPLCLVTYELDAALHLFDLDDASTLVTLGLRPTDVIRRNRSRSQEVALGLWLDRSEHGSAGISWWSYRRPEWTVSMMWSDGLDDSFAGIEVVSVDPLSIDDTAVVLAADVLIRPIER